MTNAGTERDDLFRTFTKNLHRYYDGTGTKHRWLRFCLFDHIPVGELCRTDISGLHFLNLLQDGGYISPNSVNILLEIAELTSERGAIDHINKYKIDNNVEDIEVKGLTSYRKQLFKALREVEPGELKKIIDYYRLNEYEFSNIWDAVLRLEQDARLGPNTLQEFADLLLERTKKILQNDAEWKYHFYIISEDIEWEERVMYELKRRRPEVKCMSRSDATPGRYHLENLITPLQICKKVVVGFTAQRETGNLEFVATTTVQHILVGKILDANKLIPVKVTQDAHIPDTLVTISVLNGWEEDFVDRLLNILDSHSMNPGVNIHMDMQHLAPLSEQELIKCRDELHRYYKRNCKIRLLPWLKRDPRNRLDMKHLFINLYLIYEIPDAFECPVHIQHYLELLPPIPGAFQALIRGKAGTGKTTLLEKLALDWAEQNLPSKYNDIHMFFLLKMKSIKKDDTLIDAVFRQRLFGRDVENLKSKISNYVDANPEKVILLIDAVDEYSGYGSNGHVESIIHNDSLRGASVIVTSRPWRAFEILDNSPDTYSGRNYEVKGYTQIQVSKYVNQFFAKNPDIATNLLNQINLTGIGTGIATIPIMCMLICVVFRELRTVLPDTMSDLYNKLYTFFLRHNDGDKHDSKTQLCKEDRLETISKLPELAFNSLIMQNQLQFEEGEFVAADILHNACRIGLLVQSNYNNMESCLEEKDCYEFFHKTFQEWFAASYLANKDNSSFKKLFKPMFTDISSCLDNGLFLRFLSGARVPMVAETVIKQLVSVVQDAPDLNNYNGNKLDIQKTKLIQECIELVVKCNRESKSEGCFNELLNELFDKCSARFTNVTSMTLQAITYMLKFGKALNNSEHCGESSASGTDTPKLRIEDLKIGAHSTETDGDIDKLWGEFEAVGEGYHERCNKLSKLPDSELRSIFEQFKDILPKGIQHLSLARKLAFADLCEFMGTWKGDYSVIGNVVENICFTAITNLAITGIDLSEHCELLCRNLRSVESLQKLDLGSTSLRAVHCRFIGELLESLRELRILNLNKNKLEDISEIVQRLQYLSALTRLDFETTHLSSRSISLLGQNLKWVKGLERFYIRSSPMLTEAVDDLVDGLKSIPDLRRLNITLGEQLPYEKINNLVKCMSRFQNLQLLFIDGLFSPIIDNVFRLLATDLLPRLTKLRSLRLQGKLGLLVEDAKQHVVQNATAKLLATNLKCLPNLLVLRLTYVWFEKEGLETIRSEVNIRLQDNNRFQFELYPDYDDQDSAYVPQAVLNLTTNKKT